MDINSFLIIVITLVAAVLVAVGIYLILVLIEARQSLRHLNKTLSHTESILRVVDEKVAQPAGSILGVLSVVKEIAELFSGLKRDKKTKEKDGEE